MSETAHSEIEFTSSGVVSVIRAGKRPVTPLRGFGCAVILIGVILVLVGFLVVLGAILGPAQGPIPLEGPAPAPVRGPLVDEILAGVCFGVVPFFGGAAVFYAGLRIRLANTTEIRISDEALKVIVRAGPFPRTKTRKLSEISQLRISD